MRIPPLIIKIMFESNPLKSRVLVRRLAVVEAVAIGLRKTRAARHDRAPHNIIFCFKFFLFIYVFFFFFLCFPFTFIVSIFLMFFFVSFLTMCITYDFPVIYHIIYNLHHIELSLLNLSAHTFTRARSQARKAWLRTNGVNTNAAVAKVIIFDISGEKVRHGTFGKTKVG